MSGTHGQHGVNAARNVEVVKGRRPGMSESRSNMEALCAVGTLLRRSLAILKTAVRLTCTHYRNIRLSSVDCFFCRDRRDVIGTAVGTVVIL